MGWSSGRSRGSVAKGGARAGANLAASCRADEGSVGAVARAADVAAAEAERPRGVGTRTARDARRTMRVETDAAVGAS